MSDQTTVPEAFTDLLDAPVATLATIGPDGRPPADDPDYAFATKVGAKYGGADLRQMDGDDQRRVVATIRPARVVAIDLGA
jgi:hypothetical protein